jgi:hypothetical protein
VASRIKSGYLDKLYAYNLTVETLEALASIQLTTNDIK